MSRNSLLSLVAITDVTFHLTGTVAAKKGAAVNITSPDSFRNGQPCPYGIVDPHLGTNSHAYKCHTCFHDKYTCLSHEGVLILKYPVWNILAVPEGKKWLRIICHRCGNLLFKKEEVEKYPIASRLSDCSKITRSTPKQCSCGFIQPTVKKDESLPFLLRTIFETAYAEPTYLMPHDCLAIFNRISNDTVRLMGRDPLSGPREFILEAIKIPGVNVRPDIKKMQGGHATNDTLTTLYVNFIKANDALPSFLPDKIDKKLRQELIGLTEEFNKIIKLTNEHGPVGIAPRLKGKPGRFRKNMLAKRVFKTGRSVIVGDVTLELDQFKIPMSFATAIQIRATVQSFNKERLTTYVQNGQTKKYPGASTIVKKDGRRIIVSVAHEIDLELENGDVIYRDMIDGDIINVDRAPSLTASNISAMRVVVNRDPRIKVFAFNVNLTPLFNADFDGDCMMMFVAGCEESMYEIAQLAGPHNWFISHATGNPFLGQKEDGVVLLAELTRSDVLLDKYHALALFSNIAELPDFSEVTTITGRECVSELLKQTPINLTRGTTWYSDGIYANVINYDPLETKVVIDQGKLVQGILDKKTLGKDANGAIYHLISSDYGPKKALDVMFTMQQMGIAFGSQIGYTVGILDMIIPAEQKKEIDRINDEILLKSYKITERLHRGDIIPPIGMTTTEYYEKLQQETLRVTDDFRDTVLRGINPRFNNLFKMMAYGSKGSFGNLLNMLAIAGLKTVNGRMVSANYSFGRTSGNFTRGDPDPRSLAYIGNSYFAGMNKIEFLFNAMACRFDLISKALMTAITGEQNRKSNKSLESIVVHYLRRISKNKNIVSFAYGEDMHDPRKLERVRFPTVLISDAEFEKYKHPDYPEYFEAMRKDRKEYRSQFYRIENMNLRETVTEERKVGVDIQRTINDLIRANPDLLEEVDNLSDLVTRVEDFIANFPYLLMNHAQQAKGSKIPLHLRHVTFLMCMLIRTHLRPQVLVNRKIGAKLLTIIIDKIRIKYIGSLIEPGTAAGVISAMSFCEPLTQYMLDAHSRSSVVGGTSKSNVQICKEILQAKPLEKLSAPSMLLSLKPEYAYSEAKVQEVANKIEMMNLRRFVDAPGVFIFVEKFGAPVHSDHKQDESLIKDFVKLNVLLKVPNDLAPWCFKFKLDKSALILKNMPLESIVNKIRDVYSKCYVVYSPENAKDIIVRIYFRSIMFNNPPTAESMEALAQEMMDLNIRGVRGITNTEVTKMVRTKINEDGSISRDDTRYGITTAGTNIYDILDIPEIDPDLILTSATPEVASIYGAEAGRNKIVVELKNVGITVDPRHYMIYADEMTFTGDITAIENSGLKHREPNNILLQAGFSSPLAPLTDAALKTVTEEISGITAKLLVGGVPEIGTGYSKCVINKEFIRRNKKSVDEYLDILLK